MDLQDMRIFARVAAVQNLSAVGTELNLSPGTISKRIQALEDDLRVKLFDRNTRSIRITEEGSKLLEFVDRILQEVQSARAVVGANVDKPKGRLRVSAPVTLGNGVIAPAICAFMEQHKEVDIQIDLTDRLVNLQEEGYDLVIRKGSVGNSGLMRKPLAPDPQIIVASPHYLSQHGIPNTPQDLASHACLILGDSTTWEFKRGKQPIAVRVAGRLRSDNSEMLRFAACAGLGIVRMSRLRAQESIAEQRLQRILANYQVATDTTICALYPGGKHMLPKLRVFLDFLSDWFREARANGRANECPEAAANPAFAPAGDIPGE